MDLLFMEERSNDVGENCACPTCGESNADKLEIDLDEDAVFCHSCNTSYTLPWQY